MWFSMPGVITLVSWLKERATVRFDAFQGNLRVEESEVSSAENT